MPSWVETGEHAYVACQPPAIEEKFDANFISVLFILFLAHLTNDRAYTTACVRLSVVCNVCIVAKRRVLPKNCLKKEIGNSLWGNEWSRDRRRHVTLKGQRRDPNTLRAQYLENSWRNNL